MPARRSSTGFVDDGMGFTNSMDGEPQPQDRQRSPVVKVRATWE
ncbi:hypothetical protein [Mycolicibacterium sp.]